MSKATVHNDDSQHSYFIPMVDMLAGVVFILVILLASTMLVSRNDFADAAAANAEIARINAALQAARNEERRVLEPRRRAHRALRQLLDRLDANLNGSSTPHRIDYDAGRLSIAADALFQPGSAALDDGGRRLAKTLATALGNELPCLAKSPTQTPACADYDGAVLEQVILAYRPDTANPGIDTATATARALALLSQVAVTTPALAGLVGADAGKLLTHASFAPAPTDAKTADRADKAATIVLQFQMEIPASK
jgi:hypothetical protein